MATETADTTPRAPIDTDDDGVTWISWWVPPGQRGHGVATTTARATLAVHTARPVYALIRPWNAASRRVAEKLGFTVCGVSPNNITYVLEGE